jgi:hypothetical protein
MSHRDLRHPVQSTLKISANPALPSSEGVPPCPELSRKVLATRAQMRCCLLGESFNSRPHVHCGGRSLSGHADVKEQETEVEEELAQRQRARERLKERRRHAELFERLGIDPSTAIHLIRDYYLVAFMRWSRKLRQEGTYDPGAVAQALAFWQTVPIQKYASEAGMVLVQRY